MSYAMALDNSWDILSEEEMYDVNGGVSYHTHELKTFWGSTIVTGYEVRFSHKELGTFLSFISGGQKIIGGLMLLGLKMAVAIKTAGVALVLWGTLEILHTLGKGVKIGRNYSVNYAWAN